MQEKNYQGAIVIFKTLLEQSPEEMDARFALGKAYLRTGKLDQAEKSFEKYARQNPYDRRIAARDGPPEAVPPGLCRGCRGPWPRIRKRNPSPPRASACSAAPDWAQGKNEEAKAMFEKAIALDPNQVEAELALAQLYLDQDDQAKAQELIDKLLAASPKNREGLYFEARLAGLQGDQEKYRDTLKTLVKAHPSDGYAKFLFGKAILAEGDFDSVTALAEELQASGPKLPFGKMLQGMVSYAKKDYPAGCQRLPAGRLHPAQRGELFLPRHELLRHG